MQPTRVRSALPVGLLLGLVSMAALADTFTVAPPGTMPPPDFTTIQAAIDAAADGDCVTVEPGTYVENIDFLGKSITLASSAGPEVTIIDGDAQGRVVTISGVVSGAPVIEGFTVTNGFLVPGVGAGIFCEDSAATVCNNIIVDNEGQLGGGVACVGGPCTISGNRIVDNHAHSIGGGILCSTEAIIENNVITGNMAFDYDQQGLGGGVSCAQSNALFLNNTFVDNLPSGYAGLLNHNDVFVNNTFFGNHVGIWLHFTGTVTIVNTIIWGSQFDEIDVNSQSMISVFHSNVEGGWPGPANIALDPLFVDPDGPDDILGNEDDDYHLQPDSPCINVGINDPPGGLPLTDADGNPRVICSVVDMGAYEAEEPPAGCTPLDLFIRGDCDHDFIINPVVDAIFLLDFGFVMGPTPPCLDACDADDSGDFNAVVDGLYLLSFGFTMGPPPPLPHPSCGSDPTADGVGCDSFMGCP